MLRRLSIMGTLSEVYITHFAKLVYITGLHKIFSGKALDFGYYVKILCKLPRIRRKCELSHYSFISSFFIVLLYTFLISLSIFCFSSLCPRVISKLSLRYPLKLYKISDTFVNSIPKK